jgi:hypothetical protein
MAQAATLFNSITIRNQHLPIKKSIYYKAKKNLFGKKAVDYKREKLNNHIMKDSAIKNSAIDCSAKRSNCEIFSKSKQPKNHFYKNFLYNLMFLFIFIYSSGFWNERVL